MGSALKAGVAPHRFTPLPNCKAFVYNLSVITSGSSCHDGATLCTANSHKAQQFSGLCKGGIVQTADGASLERPTKKQSVYSRPLFSQPSVEAEIRICIPHLSSISFFNLDNDFPNSSGQPPIPNILDHTAGEGLKPDQKRTKCANVYDGKEASVFTFRRFKLRSPN